MAPCSYTISFHPFSPTPQNTSRTNQIGQYLSAVPYSVVFFKVWCWSATAEPYFNLPQALLQKEVDSTDLVAFHKATENSCK